VYHSSIGKEKETTGNEGGLIFSACAGDEAEHACFDGWGLRRQKASLPPEDFGKDMATSRDSEPSLARGGLSLALGLLTLSPG
jgi:hypothetical protein